MAEVTRHPKQTRAEGLLPGDIILVHSHGKLAPRLIGFGQRLHFPPEYAYWTHAAIYVGEDMLIEAKGRKPVRYVPLAQYDIRDYAAIRFVRPSAQMRANSVSFLRSRLGRSYGYATILTLSVWAVAGGKLSIGMSGEDVCSGLAAQSSMYIGEFYDGDAVDTMPATLAQMHDIRR